MLPQRRESALERHVCPAREGNLTGVTKAQNWSREGLGDARLLPVLEAHQGKTATAVQAALLQAVAAFTGSAPPISPDQTAPWSTGQVKTTRMMGDRRLRP
jgi:hypothetical protein